MFRGRCSERVCDGLNDCSVKLTRRACKSTQVSAATLFRIQSGVGITRCRGQCAVCGVGNIGAGTSGRSVMPEPRCTLMDRTGRCKIRGLGPT